MEAYKDIKVAIKDIDKNYPLYVLVTELEWTKENLKGIKRTRKSHPSFHFQDAEEVVKRRIEALRKAIKKIQ